MNPQNDSTVKKWGFSAILHLAGRFFEIRAKIGLMSALKLFIRHRFSGEYQLKLPFLTEPIFLRGRSTDAHVLRKVFISEEYSVPNQNPRLIIDAGANVGISAIYFAHRYPEATVLCVEPEDSNAAQFLKNTQSYSNVKLLQGALWSRTSHLSISNPRADKVSFVVNESPATEVGAIPGYGIPDLLSRAGSNRIDILKIDIEGSEAQVFSGEIDNWLSKVEVILIELHENKAPGCGRRFFAATSRQPFQYYQQGENALLIRNAGLAGDSPTNGTRRQRNSFQEVSS